MDEELIYSTDEDISETDDENIAESDMGIEDVEYVVKTEETIEVVEVEQEEEINIEVDEAIGWVGGDNTRHYSLYGREENDQHPITAITGLREELDEIEKLKIVYSNMRNQADYYLWEDGNVLQENRIGYFVSLCPSIDKIQLCNSDNVIFGVTVDNAGFIGAQDYVSRDIKYGLVVTNGAVHVRCESNVDVGDYVVSNDYGYAKKNDCGYKVIGRHKIDGVECVEIALVTPIEQICELHDGVEVLNDRVDNAETNIAAAINVANAAYKKAGEVGEISEEAIKNALEALDKSTDASEKTDGFESRLESANEIAVQSKAIAESAAVSAETARKEAITIANNALDTVNKEVSEVKYDIANINTEINNSMLALQGTNEELEKTRNDLKSDIEKVDGNIAEFKTEVKKTYATIESVVTFEEEASKSISEVKQIADSNGSALSAVSGYEYINPDTQEKTTGLAGLRLQVDKNKSDVQLLASNETENSNAIAGIKATADDNKANLDILASFEYGNNQEIYPYVMSPKQEDETYGGVVTISGITFTDNGDGSVVANGVATSNVDFELIINETLSAGTYGISGCPDSGSDSTYYIRIKLGEDIYKQVGEEMSFTINEDCTMSMWIRVVYEIAVSDITFNPQLKKYYAGISGLKEQVAKNGSSIDLLTSFNSDNGSGTAGLIAKVSDHDAQLSTLTTWKSQVANEDGELKITESVAAIQEQANSQGASIQSITTWQENLEVGGRNLVLDSKHEKTSNAYGFAPSSLSTSLLPNTTYTFSVNGCTNNNEENNDGRYLRCYIYASDWTWSSCVDVKQGVYTTNSTTFVTPGDIGGKEIKIESFYYPHSDANPTGTATINWYKLEKGNMSTDWSPAPEDTITAMSTISQKADQNEASITGLTAWQGDTDDSIARIEQKADDNGASITSMVSSVDKYSVGEYSQAYGLTREQATSILKPGYIYIPTKHKDSQSHSEIFVGDTEVNEFTQGDYYVWGINDQGKADWIEHSVGSVWIGGTHPANSTGIYKYWYVDSSEPIDGYETYALYIWEIPDSGDPYWKKVNTLAGNASNRAVSMIRQTTNEIAADVTTARGDISALNLKVDSQESRFSLLCSKVNPDALSHQIDSIIYNSVDNLPSTGNEDYYYIVGTKSPYYVYYWNGSEYKQDTNLTYDGADLFEVNAASIIGAVNDSGSSVAINADHIVLNGYTSNADGSFQIDENGNMIANSGFIGSWNINNRSLSSTQSGELDGVKYTSNVSLFSPSQFLHPNGTKAADVFWVKVTNNDTGVDSYPFALLLDGTLTAQKANIKGTITAEDGKIGGWSINETSLISGNVDGTTGSNGFYIDNGTRDSWIAAHAGDNSWPFYVTKTGKLVSTDAEITGKITADEGTIGGLHIESNKLWYVDSSNTRSTGISATDAEGSPAFWAGYTGYGNHPWEYASKKPENDKKSWADHTKFYVTNGGFLYAKNAEIEGKIAATSGSFSRDVAIGGRSIKNWITSGGYINEIKATTGTISNLEILAYDSNTFDSGGFRCAFSDKYGFTMTPRTLKATDGGYTQYCTWYQIASTISGSDMRVKNSINDLSDNIENFYNSIKPRQFKFNEDAMCGNPNKIHYGVIAQEIRDSLNKNKINDAFLLDDSDEDMLKICYPEFIALNIWQIQKAKARITELEERVAQLESLLKE